MPQRALADSVAKSYERVRDLDFAGNFYRRFLATDDETRRRFAKTDFERQRDLFLHGVFALIDFARGRALGTLAVQRLAHTHGRGEMAIPSRLYDVWLRCLIETVAEHDPEWTPELHVAWVEVLAPGLHVVRSG